MLIKNQEKNIFAYKTIYILIHCLYSIFESISDVCIKVKQIIIGICRGTRSEGNLKYVYSEVQKLDKIPNHLTLLLGHENHSIRDLSNLVLWCLTAGIPFISFYDSTGNLKKRENELHVAVEKKLGCKQNVIWHNSLQIYKNGIIGQKVHVRIFVQEDGRDNIVKLTKALAMNTTIHNINITHVDKCLRKYYEFPDPDLGIYCGKTFSLFGYPPWQIRVTEFLNIKSHHNINVYDFIELLQRYSKREQRLGK